MNLWLILTPCVIGAALSFCIEQGLRPRAHLFSRPAAAFALHIGMWLIAFVFELALFHRPIFAVFNVLSFVALVTLVSNAKQASLSEPFVYQDFEYFADAIRHPRLYLPFFGLSLALVLAAGFAIIFYAGLRLEPPLPVGRGVATHLVVLGGLFAVGICLVYLGSIRLAHTHEFTLDANRDTQKYGLAATSWHYRKLERSPISDSLLTNDALSTPLINNKIDRPHFIVVQSESFFDLRRIYPHLNAEVLAKWDRVRDASIASGQLTVAAWGANTVRTEFAFLSGKTPEALGIHKFNPYRKLAKQGVPTIASVLKRQGYRTICVHPYPASFYSRADVFPLIGFDEFIDISCFTEADKSGPYVGDAAVAEKIIEILNATTQPTFVFAITMENHGPLHWEKVDASEAATLFTKAPPSSCGDIAVYARHLRNASTMADTLTQHLNNMNTPAWLCFYGDHVPIMPKVYETLGTPDGTTDYFIWSNTSLREPLDAAKTRDANV